MSAQASSSTSNGNGQGEDLQPQYTRDQILAFNKELESKSPQEILVWAIDNLDGLFQTTAFGLYVSRFMTAGTQSGYSELTNVARVRQHWI